MTHNRLLVKQTACHWQHFCSKSTMSAFVWSLIY